MAWKKNNPEENQKGWEKSFSPPLSSNVSSLSSPPPIQCVTYPLPFHHSLLLSETYFNPYR